MIAGASLVIKHISTTYSINYSKKSKKLLNRLSASPFDRKLDNVYRKYLRDILSSISNLWTLLFSKN
jgi:hypothetical protein